MAGKVDQIQELPAKLGTLRPLDFQRLNPFSIRHLLVKQGVALLPKDMCGKFPIQLAQANFFMVKDREGPVKEVLDEWFDRDIMLSFGEGDRLPHVVFPGSPGKRFTYFY
jgi:hypothetical protein